MFVKNLSDCEEFTANDGCRIREWCHPKNDPVQLPYSIAQARVAIGMSSYRHYLKQTEVYAIQQGKGRMHIDNKIREVKSGDLILVPAKASQWIENTGDEELSFLAIVSPPWRKEDDIRT